MIIEICIIKDYISLDLQEFSIALIIVLLFFILFPMDIFYREIWFKIIQIFIQNLFSPFTNVKFNNFLMSEMMSSFIIPCWDFIQISCYISNNPDIKAGAGLTDGCVNYRTISFCVTLFPFYIRFMQCINMIVKHRLKVHMIALVRISVNIAGIICFFHSSSYPLKLFFHIFLPLITWWWDVYLDWGLFRNKAYLREELTYSDTFYYEAMIINFILKFNWCLTLCPYMDL